MQTEEAKQQFVFATQGRGLYAMDENSGQYATVCGTAVGVVLIEKAASISVLVYDAQRKPLVTGPVPAMQPLQPHAANAYANFTAMGRQYSLAMPAPAATLSLLSACFALQCRQLVHGGAESLGQPASEIGDGGPLCESRWMHLIQTQPSAVLVQGDQPCIPAGCAVQGSAALFGVLASAAAAKDCTASSNTVWSGALPADAAIGGEDSSLFLAPLQHLLRGMGRGESKAFLLPQRVAHCALQTPASHSIQRTDMWDMPTPDEVSASVGASPWVIVQLSVSSFTHPTAAAPAAPAASPQPTAQTPAAPAAGASAPSSPEDERRSALADRMAKLSAAGTGRPVMMIGRARAASSASAAEHAAAEAHSGGSAPHTPAPPAPVPVQASPAAAALPAAAVQAANETAQAHASQSAADTGMATSALPSTHTELVVVDSDDDVATPGRAKAQLVQQQPAAAPVYAAPPSAPLSNAVLERVLADTGRLLSKVDNIQDSLRDMGRQGRRGAAASSDSDDSRRRGRRGGRKGRRQRKGRSHADSSDSGEDAAAGELLSSLSGLLGKTQQYQERIQALEGKVKDLRSSLKTARADAEAAHEAQDELHEALADAKRQAAAAKRSDTAASTAIALQAELQQCKDQLDAAEAQANALKTEKADAAAAAAAAAADAGSPEWSSLTPQQLIQLLVAEKAAAADSAAALEAMQVQLSAAQTAATAAEAGAATSAAASAAADSAALESARAEAAEAKAGMCGAQEEIAALQAQLAEAAAAADAKLAEAAAAADAKLVATKSAFKQEALAAIARAKQEGIALGKQQAAD